MISKKQLGEIREHLERAQNPVFFFDNDDDGLCSFLLLRRFLGQGKGVAIKSFPALDENYFRRVVEFNSDYIFILDKPVVSEEFLERVRERNIPVVWIDHHETDQKIPGFVNYYNSCSEKNENEPVTAICYEATKRKEDLWIAVLGCISDGFLPEFFSEFLKEYPDLAKKTDNAFDVLYSSRLGEIAKILDSGLKDTTTNVVNMLRFLIGAKSPYDVLSDSKIYSFHRRARQINEKYTKIFEKAKLVAQGSDKLLFFEYSGDLSVSAEIANELKYRFPEKDIVVVYIRGGKVNLSLRGKNIRDKFLKAIDGFSGATGGGHKDAVGGQMQSKDLEEFRKKLEKLIQ